jgi:hypothetical protein
MTCAQIWVGNSEWGSQVEESILHKTDDKFHLPFCLSHQNYIARSYPIQHLTSRVSVPGGRWQVRLEHGCGLWWWTSHPSLLNMHAGCMASLDSSWSRITDWSKNFDISFLIMALCLDNVRAWFPPHQLLHGILSICCGHFFENLNEKMLWTTAKKLETTADSQQHRRKLGTTYNNYLWKWPRRPNTWTHSADLPHHDKTTAGRSQWPSRPSLTFRAHQTTCEERHLFRTSQFENINGQSWTQNNNNCRLTIYRHLWR